MNMYLILIVYRDRAVWIPSEEDRRCTYKHNIEARSRDHCYHGITVSFTYSDCVFVALVTQHAKCIHCIFICGLSGCTFFFHVIS
jgi:hypothetical protein